MFNPPEYTGKFLMHSMLSLDITFQSILLLSFSSKQTNYAM